MNATLEVDMLAKQRLCRVRAATFTKLKSIYERYCLPEFDELNNDAICDELNELTVIIESFSQLHHESKTESE